MQTKINNEEFALVFNDLVNYPTLADVAAKLGMSYQSVRSKSQYMKHRTNIDPNAVKLISRLAWVKPDTPMSEHQEKFKDWTPQQCIDELRKIQEGSEIEITRNYFRIHSQISDAVWNQHFGTFDEFKRQAGVKLNRQQHQLERHIAKHASVDHYRRMNIERQDYDKLYLREKPSRFKTIVTASDLHDIEIDPFFLRVFLDTVIRVNPDIVVFDGDIFDLPEFGKYGVDPREWNVVERIRFVHENIFRPIREALPSVQIDFIEGNHEARLLRHLGDSTPALKAVLSDLHGFTIPKLLGLEEFEINYIAKSDLAAFSKADITRELGKNYKIYWDCFLAHHFPHAKNMGLPGVNGHHHKHEVWSLFNPVYGAYEWHQMGAGHRRTASYCEGEKWHNGFAIVNIDTERRGVLFDYVAVADFAVSGGKFYYREDSEICTSLSTIM